MERTPVLRTPAPALSDWRAARMPCDGTWARNRSLISPPVSRSDNKTWQEQTKPSADCRFVRVVATEPAPVIFLRIFQPLTSTTVAAASVAAKTEQSVRLIQ